MSVTFNRQQLIKATVKALDEHHKAQAAYALACQKYRSQHAAEHADRTREHAKVLRDALTTALRRSGPVLASDVKKASKGSSYYITDGFYSPLSDFQLKDKVKRPQGLLAPAEVAETKALLEMLKAATGDTISVNELKLLGMKNLRAVFVAAAGEVTSK